VATDGATLLESGCGGGYYSEIIAHRFPSLHYTGLDISAPSIELAREHYPQREFLVGSAYELPFDDRSIDIVMDGVALLQMPQWRRAIPEYARVARRTVILHGVTLTDDHPSTLFAKYAYGQPSLESVINRAELLGLCAENGLSDPRIIPGLDYDLEEFIGIPSVEETWVLQVG
jgi:ubiquinone/menaquinone biosynthesis C-methylase UbiE